MLTKVQDVWIEYLLFINTILIKFIINSAYKIRKMYWNAVVRIFLLRRDEKMLIIHLFLSKFPLLHQIISLLHLISRKNLNFYCFTFANTHYRLFYSCFCYCFLHCSSFSYSYILFLETKVFFCDLIYWKTILQRQFLQLEAFYEESACITIEVDDCFFSPFLRHNTAL
jgi:hypothetical protein